MIVSRKKVIILMIVFSMMAVSVWSDRSFAAEGIAKFSKVNGEVRIKSRYRAKGKWLRVKKAGVTLFNGDEVKTLVGSADLTFNDGSLMKISENSSLMIEERPTKKKLFGFIDMSYMNRNVKVSFGKLWANVKRARGMWTSFESRVAVAGIKGTTVSLYVDTRGDMKFSNEEGEVEIAKHDGAFTLKLDNGRDVWIKAEEGDRTLIQSVNGEMDIRTDDVAIELGDKNAIILGIAGDDTFIETTDFSKGTVKIIASVANINLDAGESVNIRSDNAKNEIKLIVPDDSNGDIGVKITNVLATLDPGEAILIKVDEVREIATIIILKSINGIYILIAEGRTYNLGQGDTMEVETWVFPSDPMDALELDEYEPPDLPEIVEESPASPVLP